MSRTKKTLMNIRSELVFNLVKTGMAFVVRTVFIYCLGKEALGLNGLFTNILSMLSLAELGISTAINFSLYAPLANKNYEKVDKLMTFYRKVYVIVGLSIMTMGVILVPFLKYFIADIDTIDNVYLIYFLYLLNTVSTYFISYKETLIIADQKKYMITNIQTIWLLILYVLQILVLVLTKQFILYLTVELVVLFVQRIVVNRYITKRYKEINFRSTAKIDKEDLSVIKKNVKASFLHKVGDYCVNGTDNIIISMFVGIEMVGMYSNYFTVITLFNTFIGILFNSAIASVGNLIVVESNEKKYDVTKKLDFLGFFVFGLSSTVLVYVFNNFISLWIGDEYCLDFAIVLVVVANFFLTGMRIPLTAVKTAAGVFDIDKFTPLIQSAINLVVSLVLAQYLGLVGVLIGTLVSSIAMPCWQRPYIVYKYILKRSPKEYIGRYAKYLGILVLSCCTVLLIKNWINMGSNILNIIFGSIVSIFVFTGLVFLVYHRNDELKYLYQMGKNIVRKIIPIRRSR